MHVLDLVASQSVCGALLGQDEGLPVLPRNIRIIVPPMPEPWPDKLPQLF